MYVKEKRKDVVISCVFGNRIDQEIASIYFCRIHRTKSVLEENVKVGIVNKEKLKKQYR